ncbi:MAG TPA: hypothetical protein VHO01_11080 [Jatrophihabitans sp.]|nr:hypothetical protein [Jatrophihabitans sp.]
MDITDLSQGFISAIRIGGPVAAAAGALALATGQATASGRARILLAITGLSGTSRARPWQRALVTAIVPALAVSVLTVALALEQEVREGPNRVIDQLAAPAEKAGGVAWIFQQGTSHFMDDSRLPDASQLADQPPAGVTPIWSELAIVQTGSQADSGLLFAPKDITGQPPFSPIVRSGSQCTMRSGRCALTATQAVTDAGFAPIGATIRVRGRSLTVVAHTSEPVSLLNRTVVFVSPAVFIEPDGTMSQPYGFIVAGQHALDRAHSLARELPNSEVLSEEQLRSENSRFWAGNGTPLLLLVIALSSLFAATSMYAARRASQEQARVAIGTLRAIGLTPGRASMVDLTRAIVIATAAALIAWPVAIALVTAANAAILGFHASVSFPLVVAALGVVVASDAVGTLVLWNRLRAASVVEAINGT